MRRHRVYEDELPSVKVGLHNYLADQCDYPQDKEINIINAFRLYFRVLSHKRGQPDYPSILDEEGQIQYSVIINHLLVAQENDPDIKRMVPFSTVGMGGGPGPAHLSKVAPATPQEAEA